jgi:hypothetical protein
MNEKIVRVRVVVRSVARSVAPVVCASNKVYSPLPLDKTGGLGRLAPRLSSFFLC